MAGKPKLDPNKTQQEKIAALKDECVRFYEQTGVKQAAADVDPESEELVGLQFDGFLAHVVHEMPSFLVIAADIGLSPQEVDQIQQKVAPEVRRRSVLEALLGHVESLAAAS